MKRLIRVAKYGLVLFAFVVLLDAGFVVGMAKHKSSFDHADSAIVLGAAIGSPAAYNRAMEAVRLVEEGKTGTVVTAGGRIAHKDLSEAQYMARVIGAKSTKEPSIILEDQSANTYENIKNAKQKIPDAESVIIVSDEFHLARGVLLAKRAGFETVYWTGPTPSYYSRAELRRYYVREVIAMLSYIPHFIFG